ncbi:MAG TPA: MFS transporter [Porphyromonadaceae bacterium]|nr:MFS transporter [Porphyromonadaceae bacterium]
MKEKLWNRNYVLVMINNFTLFFSFYLVMPLFPIYLVETFGASKDKIGLVLSGYTIVALLTRPFSGYIADNFRRKNFLLLALFIYFLFFGGYLISGSLLMFAIFRTLHGGPFGAATVTNGTMVIDVLPLSKRNEGVGFYGLSNNLATAIAPSVGMLLYQTTHDFNLIFGCSFLVAGIGFLNALRLRPPKWDSSEGVRLSSVSQLFFLKGWFILLNMSLLGFCWGILSTYIAIYGKETLGITGGTGIYFAILSGGLMLSRIHGSKSLREGKFLHNAFIGILLSTAGYSLFVLSQSMVGYYLSAVLIGLGNGNIWPSFQNMNNSIAEHTEFATANSTLLIAWDLGIGLGILLGGSIVEFFGYRDVFLMTMCIHLIGLLLFVCFTRKKYLSVYQSVSKE